MVGVSIAITNCSLDDDDDEGLFIHKHTYIFNDSSA